MRVNKVFFENYRGIRQLELDLSQQGNVVVLAGLNGSGKSSILDGLAMVLSEFDYRMGEGNRISFDKADIHNQAERGKVEVFIQSNRPITYGFEKGRAAHARLKVLGEKDVKHLQQQATQQMDGEPIERYVPRHVYFRTDYHPDGKEFLAWFLERINYENALKAGSFHVSYALLDNVREAIRTFAEVEIVSSLEAGRVSIAFEKEGERIGFHQLSDGEQRSIAFVGDIVRRLASNLDPTNKQPLHFPGIVLIDEVALHLHPRWQQSILAKLSRTFPKVQFMVSSHAPLVLGSVPREDVLLLRRDGRQIAVAHPQQSYGKDSNWILAEIMQADTRTAEAAGEIEQIEQSIEQGDLRHAKQQIEALLSRIGDDAELNTKLALIRRKEVLGQ